MSAPPVLSGNGQELKSASARHPFCKTISLKPEKFTINAMFILWICSRFDLAPSHPAWSSPNIRCTTPGIPGAGNVGDQRSAFCGG